MPNIASVLKQEISRIARKTMRAEIEGLKNTCAHYRADIAALKRRIHTLEQQASRSGKKSTQDQAAATPKANAVSHRFSAKGLRAHRQRLELSAADCGLLLGVSPQTIYNWEAEATRPRSHQLPAIAALRNLGQRDAQAILAQRKP